MISSYPLTRQRRALLNQQRHIDTERLRDETRIYQTGIRTEGRFANQMLGRATNDDSYQVSYIKDQFHQSMSAHYWLDIARRKMRRMIGLAPISAANSTTKNSRNVQSKSRPKPKSRTNKAKPIRTPRKAKPVRSPRKAAGTKTRKKSKKVLNKKQTMLIETRKGQE